LDALARAAAEIEEKVQTLRRQEFDRLVSQAELRALESQINPHFLFNALNALYGTIPRSEAVARRLVLNLAGIFRYFLQTGRSLVTVAEEMEIVRAYLEVEQVRLAGRLQVEIAIEDAALAASIPVLSLQPLVENAIKHGIARRTDPGRVRIEGECRESGLRLAILNSAAASGAPAGGSGLGLGLQNVRRRLEICFGRDASLHVDFTGPEARVELRLPVPVRAAVG
jgi:two-component system LytT family sensor kinase